MKKIFISHRGNLYSSNPEKENSIPYIENAISHGFDCEIDLWKMKNEYFLGHDSPQYQISKDFLFDHFRSLWIHCKNFEALDDLLKEKNGLNFFWHQNDNFTLTSRGYIWTYPRINIPFYSKKAITVLFDNTLVNDNFAGYCSDNIRQIKEIYDKTNSI